MNNNKALKVSINVVYKILITKSNQNKTAQA
jgi:hypothetical protein